MTTSTNQNCCLPNCINVTVNCKDCIIDTNCYINYDPLVCNLRKIYKSYEERAKNVKYEISNCGTPETCCKPVLTTSCTTKPKFWDDYRIQLSGYSYYGGCPKKSVIKFYDTKKINDLFAETYVVERLVNQEIIQSIICEDVCPFKVCQPANVPANSRFRLFFVFAYKYDLCDTIYLGECKAWKYDLYVADLPSVNCLNQDVCRVPQLQLQLVATLDGENFSSLGTKPICVLCKQPNVPTQCPDQSFFSSNQNGDSGLSPEETITDIEVLGLVLKYSI
jgi:hypothetical protein